MKKRKKVSLLVLASALSFSIFASNQANAAVKATSFEYKIKKQNGNTRGEPRLRNTTKPSNKWAVRVDWSNEEGGRTFTSFFLERNDNVNVSSYINVREGEPAYYKSAYSSANKTYVYLTAENNNTNNDTFNVKGIWKPYSE